MTLKEMLLNETGYICKTNYVEELETADKVGEQSVRDTYARLFEDAKKDYTKLTELVIILNWQLWRYYDSDEHGLSFLYNELWKEADRYACENLEGEEMSYFLSTTD